jgi:hypothetical protein
MMLADPEGIDAEPVGQHRLLDYLADDLGVAVEPAIGAGGDIAECIEPKFHCCAATRMLFSRNQENGHAQNQRGAAKSGASRATSSTRAVIGGKMTTSGSVR